MMSMKLILAARNGHYTIIDFNEVDMRIYLPEKVIFTKATRPRFISLLRVDKSSCLPKLKPITVLLYDFLIPTLIFVVEVMVKDFLTSLSNCYKTILM